MEPDPGGGGLVPHRACGWSAWPRVAHFDLVTGDEEMAVLPLAGSVEVHVEGRGLRLAGRDSVFAQVTDWAYVPVGAEVRLSSPGGAEVALPSARARRRFDPVHVEAGQVPVEVRGAGPATRQVTNFMAPGVFDGADRLMCVELLTPDGNWSSYPPHRHDGSPGCPVNNEEIYYFRRRAERCARARPGGVCPASHLHSRREHRRQRRRPRRRRVLCPPRLPRAVHRRPRLPALLPQRARRPGRDRSMAFCDDPAHHWVRQAWEHMEPDPRCPMTDAKGIVGARARERRWHSGRQRYGGPMSPRRPTVRLTMADAIVHWLIAQRTVLDDQEAARSSRGCSPSSATAT